MGKVRLWKNKGKEDMFIEKLIEEGKFTKHTKPKSLKRDHPQMFGAFSNNVVRNHINDIKRRLYLDGEEENDDDDNDDEESHLNDELPRESQFKNQPGTSNRSSPFVASIVHQNYPYFCETFKDPENQTDKVLVVVSVPGGAHNVRIELNNDGTVVILKHNWATIMYDMQDMFKKDLAAKQFTLYHPKVLSLKNGLEKRRLRIGAAPESTIAINLPIKVQIGVDT